MIALQELLEAAMQISVAATSAAVEDSAAKVAATALECCADGRTSAAHASLEDSSAIAAGVAATPLDSFPISAEEAIPPETSGLPAPVSGGAAKTVRAVLERSADGRTSAAHASLEATPPRAAAPEPAALATAEVFQAPLQEASAAEGLSLSAKDAAHGEADTEEAAAAEESVTPVSGSRLGSRAGQAGSETGSLPIFINTPGVLQYFHMTYDIPSVKGFCVASLSEILEPSKYLCYFVPCQTCTLVLFSLYTCATSLRR